MTDDSPHSSRPGSRAQSDVSFATAVADRPTSSDGPRSAVQDVEHIKSLVSRLAATPGRHDGAISAQVFRARSTSIEQVSQARVVHELDLLKRRLRAETRHERRPSQIDPGAESDADDVPDEREEELQNVREELQHVRQQREEWLEVAEGRIDDLAGQKEELAALLETKRGELLVVQRERSELESASHGTSGRVRELEAQLDEAHRNAELALSEKNRLQVQAGDPASPSESGQRELQGRLDEVLKSLKETQQDLEQFKLENENLRSENLKKIRESEETIRAALEQRQSLTDTYNAAEAELLRGNAEIQSSRDSVQNDLAASERRVSELERILEDDQTEKSDLIDQVANNTELLSEAQKSVELQGKELSELRNECQMTKDDRDGREAKFQTALARISDLEQQLSASKSQTERAESAMKEKVAEVERQSTTVNDELSVARGRSDELQRQISELQTGKLSLEGMFQEKEAALHAEVEQLRREIESLLEKDKRAQQEHESELNELLESDKTKHLEIEAGLKRQLEQATANHNQVLAEKYDEWSVQIEALKSEHAKQILQTSQSNGEISEADNRQPAKSNVEFPQGKQESQDSALGEALEAARADIVAMRKNHAATLAHLQQEMEWRAERKIQDLEQKHEAELAAALAEADEDMEERLRDQARAHGQDIEQLNDNLTTELSHLQAQLDEAEALRHAQTETTETASQRALESLHEQLKSKQQESSDLAAKHGSLTEDLLVLQARLDVELTARAEAERAFAELRKKHRASTISERKADDTREALQRQLVTLQAERDALAKSEKNSPNLEQADTLVNWGEIPKSPENGQDNVSTLKQENSELVRQVDFLVKELERHMTQSISPQAGPANNSDAIVQTDPEPQSPRNVTPLKKKSGMDNLRPQTPSEQEQLRGRSRGHYKSISFDNYLQRAQVELSELGSIISANESLFAQKIEEHVGDLKRAKDQLAQEYQDRVNALLSERDNMEKIVAAKSATEFAKDRSSLLASYGADDDSIAAIISTPKRQALRHAEGRLVAEYDKQIMKRKSQIALQHAADIQTLTEDYDRKIAQMLQDRDKLEGDLSVEPSKFEQDLSNLTSKSQQLELERTSSVRINTSMGHKRQSHEGASAVKTPDDDSPLTERTTRSQLPKRVLTSAPRTSTSIPRAISYSGSKGSPDPSSQSRSPIEQSISATERYPPVRQRSLMRVKTPSDIPHTARRTLNPLVDVEKSTSPDQESPVESLDKVPLDIRQQIHQSGGASRQYTQKKGAGSRRSMRHSSGAIYWQTPRGG